MRIFVDENIPRMTVFALREMGHDVLDLRGTPDEGAPDDVLWDRVQREGRLLITTDKGFTEYRGEPHHGILIVRLRQPNGLGIHERVMRAIARFREEDWPGRLVIMSDSVQSIWHRSGHE